jgi:hypothetical protein
LRIAILINYRWFGNWFIFKRVTQQWINKRLFFPKIFDMLLSIGEWCKEEEEEKTYDGDDF